MTTLVPREPYSKEELEKLYPKELQLQLVQVVCDEIKTFFPGPSQSSLLSENIVPSSRYDISCCRTISKQLDLRTVIQGERTPVSSRFQNVCNMAISDLNEA
jgi:acid phosphatase